MKFKRIQPYRDVFIAELHSEDVRSDGGPLIVLDGVGIHVAYYIVDDFGEVLKQRYQQGRSIRELSEEYSYPIARVRRLLQAADTEFRPRGGSR